MKSLLKIEQENFNLCLYFLWHQYQFQFQYQFQYQNTSIETISNFTNILSIEMNYKLNNLQRNEETPNTVTISFELNFSTGRSASVIQS